MDRSSSRLKVYLNLGNLLDLPPDSAWPGLEGAEALSFLKEQGFEGVQSLAEGDVSPAGCASLGLGCAGSGRIDRPADALPLARRFRDAGFECVTLHVGSGMESDGEMDALADAVMAAAEEAGIPLYVETHRATITQDVWRTLQLLDRRPALRLNGDFSHFYTGQEMRYGDFEGRLDRMGPIFERVRFMHGRIGNTSCMQVDIGDGADAVPQQFGHAPFLDDFREMWRRAMAGFLKAADASETLIFAPELLPPRLYYGRAFPGPDGGLREEGDRFAQALLYARMAREIFAALGE
jgi:hypothetical protein